jgi:hypothetical protein
MIKIKSEKMIDDLFKCILYRQKARLSPKPRGHTARGERGRLGGPARTVAWWCPDAVGTDPGRTAGQVRLQGRGSRAGPRLRAAS